MISLGSYKRGDDIVLQPVQANYDGDPIDFTDPDWGIACQLRRSVDAARAIDITDFGDDIDDGLLRGVITSEVSADMNPGKWVGDYQATGPDGVKSSQTFSITIVPDVTRPDDD